MNLPVKLPEWAILLIMIFALLFLYEMMKGSSEGFCGCGKGPDCGCGLSKNSYGAGDDYSTCFQKKQIYLTAEGCEEESMSHGEVLLQKRFGKLYITLNTNLPFVRGGVFHTMYGAYHAFLVDTKTKKRIYLGTLVRHGDRFYKLSTELLGDYRNFDQIIVVRKTEDYPPVTVLKGSITKQHCSDN